MNKRLLVSLTVASLLALNFTGCGSSKKSEPVAPTPTPVVKKDVVGTLVDAPVVGASYACSTETMKGVTNAKGEFTCKEGDTVTFKVGSLTLGSATGVKAGTVVTPYTLGGSSDAVALNIARLVQSLDNDNDRTVIDVSEKSKKLTTEIDVKATDFVTKVEAALGSSLVSEAEAKIHLEAQNIKSPNTPIPTPPSTSTTTSTSGGILPGTSTSTGGVSSTTTTTSGGILPSTSTGGVSSTTTSTSGVLPTTSTTSGTTSTSTSTTGGPTPTPEPTVTPTAPSTGGACNPLTGEGCTDATPAPTATPSTGGACNPLTGENC